MNPKLLEQLVNAVLYEGYILYPYRPTSQKNQRERFTFGRVYPESFSVAQNGAEPCLMQTECLVHKVGAAARLRISVGFLHTLAREVGVPHDSPIDESGPEPSFRVVPEVKVNGKVYQTWQQAVERSIESPEISPDHLVHFPQRIPFAFRGSRSLEPVCDGQRLVAVIIQRQAALEGIVEINAERVGLDLFRVTVKILNQTGVNQSEANNPNEVLSRTLASTHTILQAHEAEFVSLLDPQPVYREAALACRNIGTWPILVGSEAAGERDTLLSSPIILYDYPRIAPESAGTLFDGSEIDELLTLRIQTMTDQEKFEMRHTDEHARRLLERTESLPQDRLLLMHGAIRNAPEAPPPIEFDDFFGAHVPLKGATVHGVFLQAGDRVRIRPRARADVMDMALSGRVAVIEAVEEDLEHHVHLALVLEDDPGKDLGLLRQPGHRFFFGTDEVEPVPANLRSEPALK